MKNIENKIKVSLTKAIDKWLENEQILIKDLNFYWVDETVVRMAESAANVLMACKDAEHCVIRDEVS